MPASRTPGALHLVACASGTVTVQPVLALPGIGKFIQFNDLVLFRIGARLPFPSPNGAGLRAFGSRYIRGRRTRCNDPAKNIGVSLLHELQVPTSGFVSGSGANEFRAPKEGSRGGVGS